MIFIIFTIFIIFIIKVPRTIIVIIDNLVTVTT